MYPLKSEAWQSGCALTSSERATSNGLPTGCTSQCERADPPGSCARLDGVLGDHWDCVLDIPRHTVSDISSVRCNAQADTLFELLLDPVCSSVGSMLDPRTLSSIFKNRMMQYSTGPSSGTRDTCFNVTGKTNITIPRVALLFNDNVMVELNTKKGCFLFTPSSGSTSNGLPMAQQR